MYCTNCGAHISERAEVCPKCGVRPFVTKNFCFNCGTDVKNHQEMCVNCGVMLDKKRAAGNRNAKQPWLMALLSFLVIGLGQMIIGQVKKGAVMLLAGLFINLITGGLSIVIFPLSAIDAYKIAKKIKSGEYVGEWDFF